jgi:hypothetical protein
VRGKEKFKKNDVNIVICSNWVYLNIYIYIYIYIHPIDPNFNGACMSSQLIEQCLSIYIYMKLQFRFITLFLLILE